MQEPYDFVIVGSGFGGSVSALRLAEKGYRVAVLERGRRFRDQDFARTTWNLPKYLWAPLLGCRGILEISPFRDVLVLHGAGVGGGSLGYANVLMQPSDEAFATGPWKRPVDWGRELRPHYAEAKRMLGVNPNPRTTPADEVMRRIAEGMGQGHTFQPVPVGTFFGQPGEEGQEVPDPYFGGEGPPRHSCKHCGACMVGCPHDAKNTLPKNYLYLAERRGVEVIPDTTVRDLRPLPAGQKDGARFEVLARGSGGYLHPARRPFRARNVILAAGALGTQRLLFRCRDTTRSLPAVSPTLGQQVRTNNEALLGSVARRRGDTDYSKGLAITSIFNLDAATTVEPVRYPAGSSLMRLLSGPMVHGRGIPSRLVRSAWHIATHPADFARTHFHRGWAEATTILLVMQWEDHTLRLGQGCSLFTGFRKDLVSLPTESPAPPPADLGHEVARAFARETGGIPMGSINEGLLGIPLTAHILGGVPFGADAAEGVIGADCQVHGHPGLYVVDGSILPGNPGVNPSLTITAMAEFAMAGIAPKRAC